MKKRTILLFIFLFTGPNLYAKKHILKIGDSLKLPITAMQKINIKGNKFIKWFDNGSYINIIGKKEGITQINTASNSYKIQIISKKKYNIFLKYQELLKQLKGLDIDFIDNTPTIIGNLYRFSDWTKINILANKYQIPYLMNAHIDNDIKPQALKSFKPLMFPYSQLMPEIKLTPKPTIYRLKKISSNDFDHFFKLMGFRIKEHQQSNITKQIRLKLNFIEINKSKKSNFGISWTGGFQAKIIKNFIDNSSFEAYLNQASENGAANIIYQTELVCEISQECKFSEGGQFPVRTSGYINSSVVWKEYGLVLKFTPSLLSDERIKIKLKLNLSHLDSNGDGEIPAIKSKSLMTYVNTKNNSPILVSGLDSSMSRTHQNGPSPLGHIPLLNKILTSNSDNSSYTKMVLIITPTLLNGDE